MNTKSFF